VRTPRERGQLEEELRRYPPRSSCITVPTYVLIMLIRFVKQSYTYLRKNVNRLNLVLHSHNMILRNRMLVSLRGGGGELGNLKT
jgi:hypothetical protein